MDGGMSLVLDPSNVLPEYVKQLPFTIRVGWLKVYNIGLDQYGEFRALQMANLWALKEMEKLESQEVKEDDYSEELIDKVLDLNKEEFVSTELEANNEAMVTFSDDGSIVIDAILADNTFSTDGKRFSNEALISMAEQINEKGLAMPDIEHKEYERLLETSTDAQSFKEALKEQKGLLTKVKAFFQDGKLFIKAWLDKRYKRYAEHYKKLSIEAYSPKDKQDGDVYTWAEPLSFTFTNSPKIVGADLLSVVSS